MNTVYRAYFTAVPHRRSRMSLFSLVAAIGGSLQGSAMNSEPLCKCFELDDLAVVGMGDPQGLDESLFATLDLVRNHGGEQWWLYASACRMCEQNWMIAQDERIHDNFYLKRLDSQTMHEIVSQSRWPSDFLRYEQVLRLGRESGRVAHFMDPMEPILVDTANELRRERPDISVEDVAYVLAIPVKSAARLLGSD